MNWAIVIGAVAQLLFLILSNIGNKNKEEKDNKEALSKELYEAIQSGDNSRINAIIERIRLRK